MRGAIGAIETSGCWGTEESRMEDGVELGTGCGESTGGPGVVGPRGDGGGRWGAGDLVV